MVTPSLDLTKTVDKTAEVAGATLTYTVDFTNIGTVAIGTPTSGIQIVDEIPMDTDFVAASATCSLAPSCVVGYSTDGGLTYSSIEPVPASDTTHLRWAVNQALAPAATGTVGFMVVIDGGFGPGTITNTARLRIDNGPFLLEDDAETTVGLGQIRVHLFLDLNNNSVQDGLDPDLPGVDILITELGGGMQTITSDANGVTVELFHDGVTLVATKVTASGGAYVFNGLAPGNYTVRVTAPAGTAFTLQDVPADDTIDSDVNPATGSTALFAVAAGATVTDVDAGLITSSGVIGIAKRVIGVASAGGGLVDITYEMVVENLGPVALTNVQVTDDLAATFPGLTISVLAPGPTATGTLTSNGLAFNGVGNQDMLDATNSTLAVAALEMITVTVQIDPMNQSGPFVNQAIASGLDPGMATVTDISDDGTNPDPNDNDFPKDMGEDDPTPVMLGTLGDLVWSDVDGDGRNSTWRTSAPCRSPTCRSPTT